MAGVNPYAPAGGSAAPVNPYAPEAPTDWRASAWDVAKQIPAGLVAGTEAVAAFPAQIAGLVGPLANQFLPSDPEAERRQADLRALTAKQRGGGIADYLPKPETTAGEYTRTAAEFVPSAVLGSRMAIPRSIGVGTTAGLVSEAGGQATQGTALEPAFRIGGALVGGGGASVLASGAAARSAARAGIDAAEAAGNRGYEAFRTSGFTLHPYAAPSYTQPLKADLTRRGLTSTTAEGTWKVLDDIERNPFRTATEFQDRYKELGSMIRKSTNGEERTAASIAQERLLNYLENPPPWVVQGGDPARGAALLTEANQNWAAAQRAKAVEASTVKAEDVAGAQHSGLGVENELRRRIGVLADPTARTGSRFNEAEQQAFRDFARGGTLDNARRYVANLAGGRGGIATSVAGGGVFGLGSLFTDPYTAGAYGGATALGGLGLTMLGNRRALGRARELELMLLQRSPAVQAAGIPGTRSGVPYTLAPPTLATLGDER